MKLTLASDDGQQVCVAVTGEITQRDLSPLRDPLAELLGPAAYRRPLCLDLSGSDFIDSSGVGWLLTIHKRMKQGGGQLSLRALHPTVVNVLKVLKLEKVFQIEPA